MLPIAKLMLFSKNLITCNRPAKLKAMPPPTHLPDILKLELLNGNLFELQQGRLGWVAVHRNHLQSCIR